MSDVLTVEQLHTELTSLAIQVSELSVDVADSDPASAIELRLHQLAAAVFGGSDSLAQVTSIALLSEHVPLSDCYISDFGTLCCDWDDDPKYQLSLLVSGKGEIAFARYVNGNSSNCAYQPCDGITLPKVISTVLALHFPEAGK